MDRRRSVPPRKLALGVPFYGRGFGTYREGWSLDDIATSFGKDQLKSDFVGQRCGGCSYVTYNGVPTLERKGELAGAWGAGVMVWEVGQDLPDGSRSSATWSAPIATAAPRPLADETGAAVASSKPCGAGCRI